MPLTYMADNHVWDWKSVENTTIHMRLREMNKICNPYPIKTEVTLNKLLKYIVLLSLHLNMREFHYDLYCPFKML